VTISSIVLIEVQMNTSKVWIVLQLKMVFKIKENIFFGESMSILQIFGVEITRKTL
jgi:hypothetical protein